MTIEEAYHITNKLDIAEGLRRKFAPSYFLIVFNRIGKIVRIDRFKEAPSEATQAATLDSEPGCIAISARPGMDESPEALGKRIADSMWIFDTLIRKPQGSSQE